MRSMARKGENPVHTYTVSIASYVVRPHLFIIFFAYILGCVSSPARSHYSAMCNHHLLMGTGLPSVQNHHTGICRQSLKRYSPPDCCITWQKGPVFYFLWLSIGDFLPFPKMFGSSKQIRVGTDLSAVGSCEQLQNPSQHFQRVLWWENLCVLICVLIKSKYEF